MRDDRHVNGFCGDRQLSFLMEEGNRYLCLKLSPPKRGVILIWGRDLNSTSGRLSKR